MMLLSISAYAGIILLICGLVAMVRPLRFIRLNSRRRGAAIVAAGSILLAFALFWPTPLEGVSVTESALDGQMPSYHFVEHHETHIDASPGVVLDAVRAVTAREIRFFALLTWIRHPHFGRGKESILAAPPDEPILTVALRSGFVLLEERPDRELVIGVRVASEVRGVMNFAVEPDGRGGSRLWTETRVRAESPRALRAFTAYWRLIYPGSSLIRIEWLRAIRTRALRAAARSAHALPPRRG
jgi:hypothetical protein